ncbi:MAG: 16S rRNA (uracil(1498)-N(3))-methyltransferase [Spirosomaceae bacterium]|jgi:16S rRNA (uracil1498-N3)-methyltransferase|nr:16S rRNA (uracil(1498)-N(3))-methyltransferase [Spirosomataceae bacterium]
MQLFYEPNILEKPFLSEEDSKHCVRVLRHKKNDIIHVIDGKGGFFETEIVGENPKKCELRVLKSESEYGKKDYRIHLVIAPTKNSDRLEWMIEKCVEIGVDEISLMQTKHSERKIQKVERLEKIAISAMKQSLKAYLPKINEVEAFDKIVKTIVADQKFIAHLTDEAQPLLKLMQPKQSYCVFVGPEGDFTLEEVNLAIRAGFQVVTLGDSRLRTETAGLVATTVLNINQ